MLRIEKPCSPTTRPPCWPKPTCCRWFLPVFGRTATADELTEHRALAERTGVGIEEKPVFVHRDYHAQSGSASDRSDVARVGLIDFQDSRGSTAYDLISCSKTPGAMLHLN
jgi:aminoglycoside/choline kinase family phosphotransferase